MFIMPMSVIMPINLFYDGLFQMDLNPLCLFHSPSRNRIVSETTHGTVKKICQLSTNAAIWFRQKR